MSFTVKLLLLALVVVALILPMFIKGPDGRPIMVVGDWLPDFVGDSTKMSRVVSDQLGQDSATMYKWQDETGHWHFSDDRPAAVPEASR